RVNEQIRQSTDKPYNINLWVSDTDVAGGAASEAAMEKVRALYRPYFDEVGLEMAAKPLSFSSRFENQVQVILDVKPPIFSFLFGMPSVQILEDCRRRGIRTMGAATTLDEALELEAADR